MYLSIMNNHFYKHLIFNILECWSKEIDHYIYFFLLVTLLFSFKFDYWEMDGNEKKNQKIIIIDRCHPVFFFILFLLFIRSIVMMILEPESILLLLVGCCVFLVHHLEQTWEKKIIAIHIHIQNNEKLNATNLVTKIDYLYLSLSFSLWILFLFACFFLFLCLCFFIIQQHDWIQIWMKKKH